MRSCVLSFLLAMTACAAAPEPPALPPLPPWPASAASMEQARLSLEQQGYRDVVLVEALPSPSLNPPYYEGSATRGRHTVNLMVMADGSSVVLPYAPRQAVPPDATYTCRRIDFAANINTCLGVQ